MFAVVSVLFRAVVAAAAAVATDRSVSREAPIANTVVALRFLRVGGLMLWLGRFSFPDAATDGAWEEFAVSVGPGSVTDTGADSDTDTEIGAVSF